MELTDILNLFSGVALFLFGMTLMGESLKKVAGNSLELVLYKLSNNNFKSILLGALVTAVIQSSSATSVMVIGFVNSGMMKVKQAIGIIMGAIIGTSITGWIISLSSIESTSSVLKLLSTDSLTAIIAIIGIILRMFSKKKKSKNVGDIMLGFAVLMFGMKNMSASVSGLKESKIFIDLLTNFKNPIIGILAGAIFTAIIQSASAAVGILQALSFTGAISFKIAFPVLMGIGIGASFPVILGSLGANKDAKTSAWSYLIIDVVGCLLMTVIYYSLNAIIHFSFTDQTLNTFNIAFVNSAFRIIMIILLVPFINAIEKLSRLFVKTEEDDDERYEEEKLEDRFLAHPSIALEQIKIVINQMATITRDNILRSCELLTEFEEKKFDKVYTKEDIVDQYADKLGTYIVKLTRNELDAKQNAEASKYLQVLGDFERISDHACNIADTAKKVYEEKIIFSKDGKYELENLITAIQDMIAILTEAFTSNNNSLALNIGPFEELIDQIVDKIRDNHYSRIKKGACSLENGLVLNDLLTDIERVADHLENIAVEMLEANLGTLEKHKIKNELLEKHEEEFNNLFNQYKQKYKM